MSFVRRSARVGAALLLAPLLLVSCSSDDGLSRGELEDRVADYMADNANDERAPADTVTCDGGLSGDDDQRCVAAVKGIRIGLTVTADDDGEIAPVFDDGVLFAPEVIQPRLAAAVTRVSGTLVEGVSCPGDLIGVPGETIVCRVTTDGETLPVEVTVTSADGTDIQFDFEVQEPS